ncbi:Bloom syndrome protein homolog [Rhizoctonia solani]|uniref:DNA 3'-5' helicase n=1 Tax=Rhizoctonia solani TaxID=456999 RepID=A0A0K6FWE1_9AGAM|nr:Bloom syndrome protein homolog [Rhizoctonia solani]
MCEHFHWEHGVKQFQLEATKAQLLGKDTIVHASTGSGKTAIAAGPHVLDEVRGMISLFVSPLLTLHVEMTKAFNEIYGVKAVAVNSLIDGDTKALYKDIVEGKYQIVLLAPEMLIHRRFIEDVLKSNEFTSRLLAIIIDEAHCISFWGQSFRKAYAEIGIVRAFIHPSTPIIAMSGTLAPRVRRDVLNKLGFSPGKYLTIDIGNARPNVSLAVLPAKHPLNSFHDLCFLIPPGVQASSDIPKIFLYCDDKETGYNIIDYLRSYLPQELWACIRPFNASLTPQYREAAMAAFKIGSIRILVCTEAAGMGCDIPDIAIVVQWKLTDTFSAFVQRAGRAVRDSNLNGVAILVAEPNAYRVDPTIPPDAETSTETKKAPQRGGSQKKPDASAPLTQATSKPAPKRTENKGFKSDTPAAPELREDSPGEGIYAFVQTTLCRRQIWDHIYGNSPATVPKDGVACCDLCDSSFLDKFKFRPPERQRQGARMRQGVPNPGVIQKLKEWRAKTYKRDFPTAIWTDDGLLGDDFISKLAALGPIESKQQIGAILERTWLHWNRYGDSLFTLLSNLNIPPFQPLPTKTRKATGHDLPVEAPENVYGTVETRVNGKWKRDTKSGSILASSSRPRLTLAPPPQASTSLLRTPPVVPSQRRDTGYSIDWVQNIEHEHANLRREEALPYLQGYRTIYEGLTPHAATQTPYANAAAPTHPPYANSYQSYYPNLPFDSNRMTRFHHQPPVPSPAPPATPIQHPPIQQQPYYYYYPYPREPRFDM